MHKATIALAAAMAAATPMAAFAQPHPIQVNGCNPQRHGYYGAGWRPAYYPFGAPYWGWTSVYGPTYYQYPVAHNATLGIDYMNVTNRVMKTIEFGLVARGELVAEVRDVGTFSPGAEIKHEFGLNPNVFPLQTSFARCVPLRITFADGTRWRNPRLPALQRSIWRHP